MCPYYSHFLTSQAIEELGAERIGHGYHVMEDDKIYQLAKEKNIHFEVN